MGNRRGSVHSVESIRAREVRHLLNKLSLSPEQEEAIENLSHSLVEQLVRGPIAKKIALVQEPGGLMTTAKTLAPAGFSTSLATRGVTVVAIPLEALVLTALTNAPKTGVEKGARAMQ